LLSLVSLFAASPLPFQQDRGYGRFLELVDLFSLVEEGKEKIKVKGEQPALWRV